MKRQPSIHELREIINPITESEDDHTLNDLLKAICAKYPNCTQRQVSAALKMSAE